MFLQYESAFATHYMMMIMMMMMMMTMMMMMMMNCFCCIVDRRTAFSPISSWDYLGRSLVSRISDALQAGSEPAQNLICMKLCSSDNHYNHEYSNLLILTAFCNNCFLKKYLHLSEIRSYQQFLMKKLFVCLNCIELCFAWFCYPLRWFSQYFIIGIAVIL